jgi:hypothetical protein
MGFAFIPPISLPTADPVGAGLPAMAPFQSHQWRLCRHHRWQASSHKDLHSSRLSHCPPQPLWELACQRWRPSSHINGACAAIIAGKPAPTGFAFIPQPHCLPQTLWELACQRWRPSSHINGACADLIAGKSNRRTAAPTGFAFIPPTSLPTADPVGAGLPAMGSFPSHQWRLCRPHRWQVESSNRSSHRFCIHPAILTTNHSPCGSWLASDGALPVTSMAPVPTSSLASRIVEPQLPQVLHSSRLSHCPPQTLWELACQRWRPFRHINGACAAIIAGKSNRRTAAPTGFAFIPPSSLPTTAPVGAGLPAMAPFQSHQWRLCRPHRWQASSHKDLHPQACCRCTCFYCPCGAGSGSLVTRSSPHNPEVLP